MATLTHLHVVIRMFEYSHGKVEGTFLCPCRELELRDCYETGPGGWPRGWTVTPFAV